jgi:hypothetical protein
MRILSSAEVNKSVRQHPHDRKGANARTTKGTIKQRKGEGEADKREHWPGGEVGWGFIGASFLFCQELCKWLFKHRRTAKSHVPKMLEFAGTVVADSPRSFKGTEVFQRVNVVAIG